MLAQSKWIAIAAIATTAATLLTATLALAATAGKPPAPPAPPPAPVAATAPAPLPPVGLEGLKVLDVEFEGNTHIASQILLDLLETQPPLTLGPWIQGPNAVARAVRGRENPVPYSRTVVDEDVKRLAALGLFTTVRADVRPKEQDGKQAGVLVRFIVQEKPLAADHAPAKTPKGTVQAAFAAAKDGDAEALVGCFDGLTDQQADTLRQVTRLLYTFTQLGKAIETHYGPQVASQLPLLQNAGADPADIQNAAETIDGNNAVVDIGHSGPGKLPMKKLDGVWKIDAACLATLNAEHVYGQTLSVPRFAKLTQQINDDHFPNPKDALQELQKIMQPGDPTEPPQLP